MRGDAALSQIEEIYRERYASFVRLATAITRDEQAARDAVHEAFVRAVRQREQHRETFAAGWVCRIVLNEAQRRRAAEARYVPVDPAGIDAASDPNGRRDGGELQAAVAALPERQRLTLFLHYYADLDYEGIAEALDVAVGTVSATLSAARASLAARLEEAKRCEM